MHRKSWLIPAMCSLFALSMCSLPSNAQTEVQEKPPVYTYVASWQIPRAHWGEMKASANTGAGVLEKAMADGTLVGYGMDENLVHQADGATHDDWWSSTTMGGLINVLTQLEDSTSAGSPVLASATKHWDEIVVSRYYNWHPGPYKNGILEVSFYKFRDSAPDNALDTLSKHFIVPVLEKLMANGTLIAYQINTEAVHSSDPNGFAIVDIVAAPDGLDKVRSAIQAAGAAQAFAGPAFVSQVDMTAHRDELARTSGVFK